MRLADLKADLAQVDDARERMGVGALQPELPLYQVARRVAELFTECPRCEGTGYPVLRNRESITTTSDGNTEILCPRCGGTGVVPSDKGFTMGGPYPLLHQWLARFLFGEEA